MTELNLTRTDTAVLTLAAERGGRLELPARLKPTGCERLIGRLLRDGLVAAEPDGEGHVLTRAGYRAVGLEPPRVARSGSKHAMVVGLLERDEGASLAELIDATGWLPHTTRAALSRIRSSGKPLTRSERPDGANAYRLEAA